MNIYHDIETKASTNATLRKRLRESIQAPGNYKKPESIAEWMAANLDKETDALLAKTALDGTWGHIVCIGWAVDASNVQVTTGTSERDTLQQWATNLHAVAARSHGDMWNTRATWVGHNCQDFDLRFIWQRCIVLGIKLPFRLPTGRYPNGPFLYDTMKEWSGFGKYVKQTDLETAFGIDRRDPLQSGADVATAKIEDIVQHCMEDVRCLREIHQRMTA
jgi:hypothetical protein